MSPEINKILWFLPRLCNLLLFNRNTLEYGHRLLFVNNLLLLGKSKSSLFNFCRSFLSCHTCFHFCCWENVTITVLFFLLGKLNNNCIAFVWQLLRQLAWKVYYNRYQVPFWWQWIKLPRKHSKFPKYLGTDLMFWVFNLAWVVERKESSPWITTYFATVSSFLGHTNFYQKQWFYFVHVTVAVFTY